MPSQSLTSISVTFGLSGSNFDPNSFTELVGIKPTKIWHQRHEHLKSRSDLPQLAWQYEIARQPYPSIDEATKQVLQPFLGKEEAINSFCHKNPCHAFVRCVIYGETQDVVLGLEPQTIVYLAGFNSNWSLGIV